MSPRPHGGAWSVCWPSVACLPAGRGNLRTWRPRFPFLFGPWGTWCARKSYAKDSKAIRVSLGALRSNCGPRTATTCSPSAWPTPSMRWKSGRRCSSSTVFAAWPSGTSSWRVGAKTSVWSPSMQTPRSASIGAKREPGAEDGSLEDFQARDTRELGWGVGQLMEEADHVLHNRDPLSAFRAEARDLLLDLTA